LGGFRGFHFCAAADYFGESGPGIYFRRGPDQAGFDKVRRYHRGGVGVGVGDKLRKGIDYSRQRGGAFAGDTVVLVGSEHKKPPEYELQVQSPKLQVGKGLKRERQERNGKAKGGAEQVSLEFALHDYKQQLGTFCPSKQ